MTPDACERCDTRHRVDRFDIGSQVPLRYVLCARCHRAVVSHPPIRHLLLVERNAAIMLEAAIAANKPPEAVASLRDHRATVAAQLHAALKRRVTC